MKFLVLALMCLVFKVEAADLVNATDGVALDGYDVVAYFANSEKSVETGSKGSSAIQAEHKGVKYYFSSEENKDKFVKSPDTYLPAYGGWCAYAVSNGKAEVPVNNDSFIVGKDENGKKRLFLFYKSFLANTKKKWMKESQAEQIKAADKYWAKFIKGE